MSVSKHDREFRMPRISYLDFKQLEMDRVLTAFFARLQHNGYTSRINRRVELTVDTFVEEFLEHPERFTGFASHPDVVRRWVETHLLDVVNRGKAAQAVAAPRPLHGFTYRFRNTRHARDYGASQHLYELLYHARDGVGQKALEHLYSFFFEGHDKVTGRFDETVVLDVETQALLHLTRQVKQDAADRTRESFPPLCVGSADLFAEDVQRLLFYRRHIPRSVMVDYLKVLVAFHLALYHIRLFKLLPAWVRRKGMDPVCDPAACPMSPKKAQAPQADCPHQVGLLLDVVGQPDSPMARLAAHSADVHYRRIPGFVKAYFSTRKLDEFAQQMRQLGKLARPHGSHYPVGQVLRLLEPQYKADRDMFFGARVSGLIDKASNAQDAELDPEIQAVIALGLPPFDAYVEMLVALRGRFHRHYITQCLDSLLLKNRPGALVAQGMTKDSARRFVLDSRLLEVLLQIAVLRPGGALNYHTGEMRIDDLLHFLSERYGLYIDRLPTGDGFGEPTIGDRQALRTNGQAFISRLREVGFFRDLSDAYVTQTVTPRYRIDMNGAVEGG
jgi:hypothetical protein